MRSVRLNRVFRRGPILTVVSGGGGVSDPAALLGADLLTWRDSRDAVESGGILTAWPDRVGGAALSAISGSPAVATDAALNNLLAVRCDGVSAAFSFIMDRPVPTAGTPTCLVFVMKQVTWTSVDALWGAGANILCANQVTGSPGFVLRNSTVGPLNSGLALDTWKMVIAQYSNETTDYSQVGQAAQATGTALGAVDPGATFTCGARTGPASFSDTGWGTIIGCGRKLSAGDIAGLIAWFNSIYPPAVTA